MHVAEATSRTRLPGIYWAWLVGAEWTSLGTQVLAFGMTWTATATSASLAGIVLACSTLPRALLSVVGGAVGDRYGPPLVMLVSGVAIVLTTTGTAVYVSLVGPSPALLVIAAVLLGTASAFYVPASGAMPRLLVPVASLPKAMASWSTLMQISNFVAPPLGGVIVTVAGLTGSAAVMSIGAAVMVFIMFRIARSVPADEASGADNTGDSASVSFLQQIVDGVRVTLRSPLLRGLVLTLIAVAGFILPLTTLMVPLIARTNGWSASSAGFSAGAFTVGSALVAVTVMRTGGFSRPGLGAGGGLVAASAGTAVLALADSVPIAVPGVFLAGVGTGLFTTHAAPLLLGGAPKTHVARVQSILLLAQSLPLLVANTGLGYISDAFSATTATLCCAVGVLGAASIAFATPSIRQVRRLGE